MSNNKYLKPRVLIPVLAGLAAGVLLFVLGEMDDAPGLCLIGLVAGFFLVMYGAYNSGIITKGLLASILLLCYGTCGVVLPIVLLLDAEFGNRPELSLIGIVPGIVMLCFGIRSIRKEKKRGGDHF